MCDSAMAVALHRQLEENELGLVISKSLISSSINNIRKYVIYIP